MGERTRPEGGFAGTHPRDQHVQNGRRGRRNRGRGRREPGQGPTAERPVSGGAPPAPVVLVPTGETVGWFDPSRDGGFIRRALGSYLADTGDAYGPPHLVREFTLRKSDEIRGTTGRDQRGRIALIEITEINGRSVSALVNISRNFGTMKIKRKIMMPMAMNITITG